MVRSEERKINHHNGVKQKKIIKNTKIVNKIVKHNVTTINELKKPVEKYCKICGCKFMPIKLPSGRYSTSKYCSQKCSHIDKIKNGKEAYKSTPDRSGGECRIWWENRCASGR